MSTLELDAATAALIARALRFTAGDEAGGVDTEMFEEDERAELLKIADALSTVIVVDMQSPGDQRPAARAHREATGHKLAILSASNSSCAECNWPDEEDE